MKFLNKKSVLIDVWLRKCIAWGLAVLPLVGAFPGLSSLRMHVAGFYLPSQFLLVAVVSIAAAAYCVLSPKEVPVLYRKAGSYFAALCFLFVIWGIISAVCKGNSLSAVVVQALWLITPAMYGFCVVGVVVNRVVGLWDYLFDAVVLLAGFSLFLVVYNIGTYGASFLVNRLYCPGLGTVISGYTFAIGVAVAFFLKRRVTERKKTVLCVAVAVLLVSVFWTGSRGGAYPALIMAALFFLPEDNAAALVLLVLGALIVAILFDPLGYLLSGRMSSLESGRYSTWDNLLGLLGGADPVIKIFGYGLGNLFPYQQWFTSYSDGLIVQGYTDGAWNHFTFEGVSLLVEPHNSMLWLLGECGFVGLSLVICLFVWMIAKPRARARTRAGFAAVVVTFVLLNCFDSVVFGNMASATWWLYLFLSFYLLTSEGCNGFGDFSNK